MLVMDGGARGAASSLFLREALAISEENAFGVDSDLQRDRPGGAG